MNIRLENKIAFEIGKAAFGRPDVAKGASSVNAIKRSAAERLSPDSTGTDGGAGNSHLNGASGQKHVSSQDAPKSSMPSRWLIFLLAITSGLVAMNIFYNQPILNEIGGSLKVESSAVAWVAIVTQLGYAAGLLLVVPIGDSIDRKHLITATTIGALGVRSCAA